MLSICPSRRGESKANGTRYGCHVQRRPVSAWIRVQNVFEKKKFNSVAIVDVRRRFPIILKRKKTVEEFSGPNKIIVATTIRYISTICFLF